MKNFQNLVFFLVLGLGVVSLYIFYVPGFSFKDVVNSEGVLHQIIFNLRIPRLLFVLAVGGALSALGGAYQVLFKNSLAEPYVLGVSSSVSLVAAVLNSVFGVLLHSVPMVLAGCGAGVTTSLFLLSFGGVVRGNSTERLVLFGMSLNFVLSSLLFLYLTYASHQLGGGTMQWLFGHIPWVSLRTGIFFFVLCIFFVMIWVLMGRQLDAMAMGDLVARTLGVSPDVTRTLLVISSSLFLGLVVTQTGAIGFVGLVVPHSVRLLFAPRSSRSLFLYSFAVGAVFLAFCDFLSRNILPPMEFPIGIITTLVGAPIFLWLLWKR